MPKFIEKINPESTAVLVVDMQNAYLEPTSPLYVEMGKEIVEKMPSFLDKCRDAGIKVIYTQQSYRKDGADIGPNIRAWMDSVGQDMFIEGTKEVNICSKVSPKENEIVVKKNYWSAFYMTNLDVILRANGIKTVAIIGLKSDVSCFATVRDSFCLDYENIYISDLMATAGFEDIGYGGATPEECQIAAFNTIYSTSADLMTSEKFLDFID